MNLEAMLDRLARTLSGGMLRRLEIATALLNRPAVLFLDEPTVGLDPTARRMVWERLEALREQAGTTILFTTHIMEEAERYAESPRSGEPRGSLHRRDRPHDRRGRGREVVRCPRTAPRRPSSRLSDRIRWRVVRWRELRPAQ
jgi:ABC-2 type transport system ATP-binding protein